MAGWRRRRWRRRWRRRRWRRRGSADREVIGAEDRTHAVRDGDLAGRCPVRDRVKIFCAQGEVARAHAVELHGRRAGEVRAVDRHERAHAAARRREARDGRAPRPNARRRRWRRRWRRWRWRRRWGRAGAGEEEQVGRSDALAGDDTRCRVGDHRVAAPAAASTSGSPGGRSAAAPATCGDAIDVPLIVFVAVSLVRQVEAMPEPGANRSRQLPKLEKLARASVLVVAPTVIAVGVPAGVVVARVDVVVARGEHVRHAGRSTRDGAVIAVSSAECDATPPRLMFATAGRPRRGPGDPVDARDHLGRRCRSRCS